MTGKKRSQAWLRLPFTDSGGKSLSQTSNAELNNSQTSLPSNEEWSFRIFQLRNCFLKHDTLRAGKNTKCFISSNTEIHKWIKFIWKYGSWEKNVLSLIKICKMPWKQVWLNSKQPLRNILRVKARNCIFAFDLEIFSLFRENISLPNCLFRA